MSNRSRRTPSTPHSTSAAAPRGSHAPEKLGVALLLIGGSVIGAGLGAWLLAFVWPVDPEEPTALVYGIMTGLFSGLLGASAVAGSLTMASNRLVAWLSPIAGVMFAVGFTGLVLASMGSVSAPWMLIGIVGIGACVVWFYALGMISGQIPPLLANQYGTWVAPIVGIALIVYGILNGNREVLVGGVLAIAAWAGILIGSLVMQRRMGTAAHGAAETSA